MILKDDRRIFSFGELWGPAECECVVGGQRCGKEAWAILLSAEENKKLPEESGPKAIAYIFMNELGIALCEKHLPKE